MTSCFEDEVNRLLSESSGLAGYVAVRNNVQAIGKTIWTRSQQGGLGYEVIIDANKIGPWGLNNARCLTTVLHELSHVLYEGRHLERLGEAEYTSDLNTKERWFSGWAKLILDEFDVDRLVDALVVRLAKRDDGRPWSLQELEEGQGVDWIQELLDGLNKMPCVVEEKVWRFRTWQMSIDDLAEAVIPAIQDILILLSHTASMYMETESWPDILQRIKTTDASRRFLKEHLDTILNHLNDVQIPFEESVQIVARAVEGIFQHCGLSLKTVPEGVYISVDAPSL